jgi:hypothetical protein
MLTKLPDLALCENNAGHDERTKDKRNASKGSPMSQLCWVTQW